MKIARKIQIMSSKSIFMKNNRIKSLEYDSDEKRIEAARLASSDKDFEAVARILSSVKNPKKNNYVKSNFLIIEAEKAIHQRNRNLRSRF